MKQGQSFAQVNIVKNFGDNTYSRGMELVLFSPETTIADVMTSKEYWLNPSAPWDSYDKYGLKGSEEQYKLLYKNQVATLEAKADIAKFGDDWSDPQAHKDFEKEFLANFKPWWEQGSGLEEVHRDHFRLFEKERDGEARIFYEGYLRKGEIDLKEKELFKELFLQYYGDVDTVIHSYNGVMNVHTKNKDVSYYVKIGD